MLYVERVELVNFRCFENITIEADVTAERAPWTLLTGNNASGKTTLLKAIALGLCDQSSAAGLLRESDSGYIRHGEESGTIKIHLVDPEENPSETDYWINTVLKKVESRFDGEVRYQFETLEQDTIPGEQFPWDRIFVCGYGAGRGTSGTGDIAGYSAISAVYNLFNYSEGLQNPELTIRRLQHESSERDSVLETLESVLNLSEVKLADSETSDMGISVKDNRNADIALRDLADGYKSTFLWITDLLGWARAKHMTLDSSMDGIVVIDEIEQHLHPKWQKRIISDLRNIWPNIQFLTATHSPLVARSFKSTLDDGPYRHYHLRDSEDRSQVEAVPVHDLGGYRTDQILASEAFDYLIDDDPDANLILDQLLTLSQNDFLAEERRTLVAEYMELVDKIHKMRSTKLGQTLTEMSAAELIELTQRSLIDDLEKGL